MLNHEVDLKKFRQDQEEYIKKNWLVVVGLDWLKEGENSLGSAANSNIHLPKSAPGLLGKIYFSNKQAEIEFLNVKDVMVADKPAQLKKKYPLQTDKMGGKYTVVKHKNVQFHLIDRPNGIGVRSKDLEAEAVKAFKGLEWWEAKSDFRIVGEWKPLSPPKTLIIPDVLGNMNEEKISGSVVFKIKDKQYELYPTRTENRLFFIFKDQTSGKSSYGTGRFLSADVSKEGSVILDFNKANNPPCAYTTFATCPLPPAENKLEVAIEAGEKKPAGH